MAINIPLGTNIKEIRSEVDATLNAIGDLFNTSNSKISREYLGEDFSQAMRARLNQTTSDLAASHKKAIEQIKRGNPEAAESTNSRARLNAASQVSSSLREEVKHISTINTSYRRQKQILDQVIESRRRALEINKDNAAAHLQSQYSDKMSNAIAEGKPIGALAAESNLAIDQSNDSYDELIDSLDNLAATSKEQLSIERQLLSANRRSLLSSGVDRTKGFGGGLARGALAGAGLLGITSVVGIVTAMISEGMKLDEAESSTAGLRANIRGSGTRFGKSRSEFLEYGRQAAMASGRSGYDAQGQLTFERGAGMDEGSMMGLASLSRLSTKNDSAGQMGAELVATFRDRGLFGMKREDGQSTYVQLQEKLNLFAELLTQQRDRMKSIDESQAIGVLSMFGERGYEDNAQISQLASSIDQSITNPGDDFRRAFILNSLQQANPGEGYIDLLRRQEKGLYGEGNFNTIMDSLKSNYGGNADELSINTSRAFGINLSQADEVTQMYMRGDKDGALEKAKSFNAENDPAEKMKLIVEDLYGSGGTVQQAHAKIKDFMAGGGKIIIDGVAPLIKSIDEFMQTTRSRGFLFALKELKEELVAGIVGIDWEKVGSRIAAGMKETVKTSPRESDKAQAFSEWNALTEQIGEFPSAHKLDFFEWFSDKRNQWSLGVLGSPMESHILDNNKTAFRDMMRFELKTKSLYFDTDGDGKISKPEEARAQKLIEESTLEQLIMSLDENTRSNVIKTQRLGHSYERGNYHLYQPANN